MGRTGTWKPANIRANPANRFHVQWARAKMRLFVDSCSFDPCTRTSEVGMDRPDRERGLQISALQPPLARANTTARRLHRQGRCRFCGSGLHL